MTERRFLFLLSSARSGGNSENMARAAATGLALVAARGTPALPSLLCVHLGVVMALFATMPYGKFAHGMYRAAALLKWAIEKRQPSRLKLAQD